jgi:hypothetical protein
MRVSVTPALTRTSENHDSQAIKVAAAYREHDGYPNGHDALRRVALQRERHVTQPLLNGPRILEVISGYFRQFVFARLKL